MTIRRMSELDLTNKRVLIRQDLNVPIRDGGISNDARLQASLPTIKEALSKGSSVILCSHLGRPSEGVFEEKFSLKPIADYLSNALGIPVPLISDYLTQPFSLETGQVVLLENVRFNNGEKKDDESLAQQYAALADVFVMDAFGTAHRAQASTHGVIKAMQAQGKSVCAGPLLASELDALDQALAHPQHPIVAIVGGSKVSTKLDVLISLADLCDHIIVGGGIANTFLAAQGYSVGASLYEPDMCETAKQIMQKTHIVLPQEVTVVAKSQLIDAEFLDALKSANPVIKSIDAIDDDDMILDFAASSAQSMIPLINTAKTIIWNGPVGVFEVDAFAKGTQILAQAIADSEAFSLAGGGDTLAAIDAFSVSEGISYTSTGGGAFLEFIEGKTLPAVAALTH